MTTSHVRTQAPRGELAVPRITRDADEIATYEEDAARARGRAAGVARPASEGEIALRCGFQTPFHFSRWVRETEGASPREVRARAWGP